MLKALVGFFILGLFIYFLYYAVKYVRERRAIDNAKSRLNSAQLGHTLRDYQEEAEELEAELELRVSPTVSINEGENSS